MLRRIAQNYLERHLHPVNRLLHLFGIPLTFVVPVIFLIQEKWTLAVTAFMAGYAVQFLGHAIEGNDAGELILVKRAFGLPYREFGPRHKAIKD